MIYIYVLITIITNNFINLIISENYELLKIFTPLTYLMLIPVLAKYIKNKKTYFIIIILIALIMFLGNENIVFLNILIVAFIGSIILIFFNKHELNLLSYIITNIIIIIIYNILNTGITDLYYHSFSINNIFQKILNSLSINIIYTFITYFIFCHKLKN